MKTVQAVISEALEKEPMDIKKLKTTLGMSESYLRTQIRLMEETGRVEKVDQRFPYMYQVPPDSPAIKHREQLALAKAELLNKEETKNPFVKSVRTFPKKDWPKIAESLEVLIEAIRKLDSEGKLIDTL